MYYELYVDSLFLVNFIMNLYLLLLVNQSTCRTATRLRLVLGAALGAGLYLSPFLYSGPVWARLLPGFAGGTAVMVFTAFRIRSVKAFLQIVTKLLLYSLLMGGTLLFLIRRVKLFRDSMTGIAGVLGMGAAVFFIVTWLQERHREQECLCRVTLIRGAESICVSALIDSGNSLTEPISGKPVSVIEKETFNCLWKKGPELYRAIPFHSIGKKRGILRGYLVPEIRIEINGMVKTGKDVYVAVSDEKLTGAEDGSAAVRMILNPALLEKQAPFGKRVKKIQCLWEK